MFGDVSFHFHNIRRCNVVFSRQKLMEYMQMPLLQSQFLAENWKYLKDTLAFLSFLVGLNRNRILLTSDLLPNISLVVGQSSVNISLGLRAPDISTSRLTSNQRDIGQQITVSKNLFLGLKIMSEVYHNDPKI